MDANQIITFFTTLWALIVAHKWIPILALCIGGTIRVIKSDQVMTLLLSFFKAATADSIKKSLPTVALVLGVLSTVLNSVISGTSWPQALLEGVLGAFGAVAGHEIVVEHLLGGNEFFNQIFNRSALAQKAANQVDPEKH